MYVGEYKDDYKRLFPYLSDRVKVAMNTPVTGVVQDLEIECGDSLKYRILVPVRYVNFMCFDDQDEQALNHMAILLGRIDMLYGITGAMVSCVKLPLPEYSKRRVLWLSYIATFAPEENQELSIYPEGVLPGLTRF